MTKELKEKIDLYLDSKTPEELLDLFKKHGMEEIDEALTISVVVECKHDFEPYYNWCSELTGYRCEKCGEEKD